MTQTKPTVKDLNAERPPNDIHPDLHGVSDFELLREARRRGLIATVQWLHRYDDLLRQSYSRVRWLDYQRRTERQALQAIADEIAHAGHAEIAWENAGMRAELGVVTQKGATA